MVNRPRWALGIYGNKIVGTCSDSSGRYRGYIYDGSTWTIINAPGASDTWVCDTYDKSTVGYDYLSGNVHGFIYNGSQWQTLDKPGAGQTFPNGIDGSNIVGRFNDSLGSHGFIFNGYTWTTLDMPGAQETEVRNSSGSNLIGCYLAPDNIYRSFIYNNGSWTPHDPLGQLKARMYRLFPEILLLVTILTPPTPATVLSIRFPNPARYCFSALVRRLQ